MPILQVTRSVRLPSYCWKRRRYRRLANLFREGVVQKRDHSSRLDDDRENQWRLASAPQREPTTLISLTTIRDVSDRAEAVMCGLGREGSARFNELKAGLKS